jgi:hypothetical protein
MNDEIKTKPNLEHKVVRVRKRVSRSKRYVFKFDKEGFSLAMGIGMICSCVGVLIIWATKTAPEGISTSTGYSTSQRLAHVLPESTQATLGFIVGILFLLFGVVCIFLGLKIVIKYFTNKLR